MPLKQGHDAHRWRVMNPCKQGTWPKSRKVLQWCNVSSGRMWKGTVDYVEIERIDFLKDSESSFVGIQLPFYKRIRVKTISKEASKRCLTASGLSEI